MSSQLVFNPAIIYVNRVIFLLKMTEYFESISLLPFKYAQARADFNILKWINVFRKPLEIDNNIIDATNHMWFVLQFSWLLTHQNTPCSVINIINGSGCCRIECWCSHNPTTAANMLIYKDISYLLKNGSYDILQPRNVLPQDLHLLQGTWRIYSTKGKH